MQASAGLEQDRELAAQLVADHPIALLERTDDAIGIRVSPQCSAARA
jgi:hypothetical protein